MIFSPIYFEWKSIQNELKVQNMIKKCRIYYKNYKNIKQKLVI